VVFVSALLLLLGAIERDFVFKLQIAMRIDAQ
jgi:hypothetical protein